VSRIFLEVVSFNDRYAEKHGILNFAFFQQIPTPSTEDIAKRKQWWENYLVPSNNVYSIGLCRILIIPYIECVFFFVVGEIQDV